MPEPEDPSSRRGEIFFYVPLLPRFHDQNQFCIAQVSRAELAGPVAGDIDAPLIHEGLGVCIGRMSNKRAKSG